MQEGLYKVEGPLFETDMITLTLKGFENGDMVDFEGSALQRPASPSRRS